ncbi:MAG: T9SS type A sorting domain-containing protein, partial [Saprospiraceae bacterium]|nr:T9SS type A sorting domain-containing protein [Saprospiraceae bacterium]
ENLLLQIVADRNTDLQQCSVFLATLPQTTTYELNQKFLNGLAIKMGQNISFSQSDSTMLRTIAAQCPEIAGYTRERAMNRLPVGDAAIYRPDVPYVPGCQGLYGGGGDRDVDLLEVASGVGIAPNPAAERLTIRFETPFAGIVQILDMAGRHTDSKMNLTGQTEHSFSVEKLSPGVYFLLILSDAGERKTLKFVVSK